MDDGIIIEHGVRKIVMNDYAIHLGRERELLREFKRNRGSALEERGIGALFRGEYQGEIKIRVFLRTAVGPGTEKEDYVQMQTVRIRPEVVAD